MMRANYWNQFKGAKDALYIYINDSGRGANNVTWGAAIACGLYLVPAPWVACTFATLYRWRVTEQTIVSAIRHGTNYFHQFTGRPSILGSGE